MGMIKQALLALLKDGKPRTYIEMSKETGFKISSICNAIHALKHDYTITKNKRGKELEFQLICEPSFDEIMAWKRKVKEKYGFLPFWAEFSGNYGMGIDDTHRKEKQMSIYEPEPAMNPPEPAAYVHDDSEVLSDEELASIYFGTVHFDVSDFFAAEVVKILTGKESKIGELSFKDVVWGLHSKAEVDVVQMEVAIAEEDKRARLWKMAEEESRADN